jgi:hypothetical protein
MTDGTTSTDETAAEPASDETAADAESEGSPDGESSNRVTQSLLKVGMVVLILLALVATFRFYFAASNAISIWFSSDFVPIFQAAFNLLLLLASVAGLAVIVRRIRS